MGVGIVIVLLVLRASGRQTTVTDLATASRRFAVYLIWFVAFVVGVEGLRRLLDLVLIQSRFVAHRSLPIASAASLALVGGAVWIGLRVFVDRRLAEDPTERSGLGWMLYLTAALAVAVSAAVASAVEVLAGLLSGVVAGRGFAGVVAWGFAWFVHGRWGRDPERQPALLPEAPALVGSLVGLVAWAVGAGILLTVVYEAAVEALVGTTIAVGGGTHVWKGVALVAVGGTVWGYHWFGLGAVGDVDRPTWLAYVLLGPVLVSTGVVLVAGALVLFQLLVWFVGDPGTATAVEHFGSLPGRLAAVTVAAVIWIHHRLVLRRRSMDRREPDRVYDYLLAGAGLAAFAVGLWRLLDAGLPPAELVLTGGGSINQVLGAVTALLVGGAVWWFHWRRCEAARIDPAEVASPSRRVYLVAVLAVAGTMGFVAAIGIVRGVFVALLGGGLAWAVLRGALVSALTAVVIGGYHLQVWRADRRRGVATPVGVRELVLVATNAVEAAAALRRLVDARVRPMVAATGPPVDPDRIAAALDGVEARRVLVVAVDGEPELVELR
ncbi:MAG TPA: hypothetical protein ENK55_10055 [Actinobacteria bacterium]|nr:hypothetical protein [Actinomycetota bacterium]